MKILKLLNKKNLSIYIIFTFLFSNILFAEEEPVDIWKLEKTIEENSSEKIIEENNPDNDPLLQINNNTINFKSSLFFNNFINIEEI